MGWFDEQIKERRQYDDDAFSEAFANMASAVMGKRFEAAFTSDRAVTKDAIDEILKYYHVKSREVPDSIKDVNEQLEFLMRPYGIMRRTVKLEDGWYRRRRRNARHPVGERASRGAHSVRSFRLQLL